MREIVTREYEYRKGGVTVLGKKTGSHPMRGRDAYVFLSLSGLGRGVIIYLDEIDSAVDGLIKVRDAMQREDTNGTGV